MHQDSGDRCHIAPCPKVLASQDIQMKEGILSFLPQGREEENAKQSLSRNVWRLGQSMQLCNVASHAFWNASEAAFLPAQL